MHPNPHCLPLQLLGFCCCCCCCYCCEVQMQAHLTCSPPLHTPPELQLCPHMPLLEGFAPQWCKHLGPPHRPLNWGRTGCNAGCNGCILAATACCTSGLRQMMSSRAGPSSSVRFRLVQPRSNSDACPLGDGVLLGGPRNYRIKKSKYCEV